MTTTTDTVVYGITDSPIGALRVAVSCGALVGVHLEGHPQTPPPALSWRRDDRQLDDARAQLDEYFAGTRTEFDLRTAPTGTPFQRQVWAALAAIPYGQTRSYGDIAQTIGRPSAVRAVGAANGANPVSIIIPCHRVIGADGTLTGYGWGVERKRWLLAHERPDRWPAAD